MHVPQSRRQAPLAWQVAGTQQPHRSASPTSPGQAGPKPQALSGQWFSSAHASHWQLPLHVCVDAQPTLSLQACVSPVLHTPAPWQAGQLQLLLQVWVPQTV
jgi:hypothetical protein